MGRALPIIVLWVAASVDTAIMLTRELLPDENELALRMAMYMYHRMQKLRLQVKCSSLEGSGCSELRKWWQWTMEARWMARERARARGNEEIVMAVQ